MAKKAKVKRGSSVGAFFFGSFIGFILCLAAIVGLVCFVYFKVSPEWLNKHFNANIDLGSEEVNKKSLSDFVNSAVNLANNASTYTLTDLKKDFGIEVGDDLFGLDIADLKSVGLEDLPKAIEDKFASISADELRGVVDLDDMSGILDKCNTYYFNSGNSKLYQDFNGTTYSNEVDFKYDVDADKTKITTKGHETTITNNDEYGVLNQVDIQLWYLPLTVSLGDFTSNMGSQITLKELETDYGVTLPSFLDNIDKENTTINELEDAINGLYVADFLGYTVDDSNPNNKIVRDDSEEEVSGLMYELAIETIGSLDGIESKFSSLTAVDLEDTLDLSSLDKIFNKTNTYYVNGTKLYEDSTHTIEVDFEYEIKGSNVVVEGQNFAISAGKVDIVLKYLPLATAISDFTSDLGNKLTLQELKDDYGVVLPSYIINGNENKTINEIETIIDNLYVRDILGYKVSGSDVYEDKNNNSVMDEGEKVPAILGIIGNKKVGGLDDIQSTIEAQTIATLLDYTVTVDNSDPSNPITTVTDKQGTVITGLLAKVAPFSIKNVDSAIDTLTLSDIFESEDLNKGVFKLLDQSTVGQIKVVNVADELQDAIKSSTINDLIDAELVTLDSEDEAKLTIMVDHDDDISTENKAVGSLTINELLDYCFDLIPTT